MEHMTFWQQFIMALAHGGPPTLAAIFCSYFTYRGLAARQNNHHASILEKMNGDLQNSMKAAAEAALNEIIKENR